MPAHYKDVNLASSLPPPRAANPNNNRDPLGSFRISGPRRYGNSNNNNNNRLLGETESGLTALPPYSTIPPTEHRQTTANHNLDHQQAVIPLCARALGASANATSQASSNNQHQVTLCQEDADYPTKAVMGALELYGPQILEQIMPQTATLVNSNHLSKLAQQQLQLDSLRPPPPPPVTNIGPYTTSGGGKQSPDQSNLGASAGGFGAYGLSPSANYDNLCKAKVSLVQPRRAKNLQGQWKVVVNFPNQADSGKFRGISLSQPVRIEECSGQLNNECGGADKSLTAPIPKTRCLQQYEDHRLVAWSAQRGLHVDMFRLPVSCSCHLRR